MRMELAWRFSDLLDQIREIQDDLMDKREELTTNHSPSPPHKFDPLKTIGKY
jgi:hypothetical protein